MRLLDNATTTRGGTHPAATCRSAADTPSERAAGSSPEVRSAAERPDPDAVLPALARIVMEVLAGRRPLTQLEPMLSPAVVRRLSDRIRTQYRTDQAPSDRVRVRRVTTCWVNERACEGVVTVEHVDRTTALAIRIEQHERGWRVVEVAGPEFAWRPIGPGRTSTGATDAVTGLVEDPRSTESAQAQAV